MAIYQAPIVIGIFQIEIQAKHAVDAIRSAGFRYDQVGVAISSSSNATPDLQADLTNLGVSQEKASYYDNAYKSGNVVVSIRPDGREDEIKNILFSHGAYSYENRTGANPATEQPQANQMEPQPSTIETNTGQYEDTQSVETVRESSSNID